MRAGSRSEVPLNQRGHTKIFHRIDREELLGVKPRHLGSDLAVNRECLATDIKRNLFYSLGESSPDQVRRNSCDWGSNEHSVHDIEGISPLQGGFVDVRGRVVWDSK